MNILAISGSGRANSTNTAMLQAVADIARLDHSISVFSGIASLPVFSPDLEIETLPVEVQGFVDLINDNDCLIIASPEYVRAIPGGLKNAIDWLVSRDEIIDKPVVLMHASHRGDDMLGQLRLVLSTVSQQFSQDLFLRFDLMKLSPEAISSHMTAAPQRSAVLGFLRSVTERYT